MSADPLRNLRNMALLGRSREQAVALASEIATTLLHPDPPVLGAEETERELLAWAAELAFHRADSDAARRLTEAARRADRAGEAQAALRLRLLAIRATATLGRRDRAADLLVPIALSAEAEPSLHGDLALARAAVAPHPPREELERALLLLPSPARDHDRLAAHLALADLLQLGADRIRARVELESALQIALRHEDRIAQGHVQSLFGAHLVEIGLAPEAIPPLRGSFDLALNREDDLRLVTIGTLLVALYQSRGLWGEAEEVALCFRAAAERRKNWIGLADATIAATTSLAWRGQREAALELLVDTGAALAERGADAALNLIKARLAELRGEWGEEEFARVAGMELPPVDEEEGSSEEGEEDSGEE